MTEQLIRILMVDDDEDDFIIIRDLLAEVKDQRYRLTWISSYEQALVQIKDPDYDLFLFDFHLGAHTGLKLLEQVKENGWKVPVIFLTEHDDRQTDLQVMKSGAFDFIPKSEITSSMLERSIRYAIERQKIEEELFQQKDLAEVTLESIGDSVITVSVTGKITGLNRIAQKLTGWSIDEARGMSFDLIVRLIDEFSREPIPNQIQIVMMRNNISVLPAQSLLLSRDASEHAVEGTAAPIHNRNNEIIGVVVILHDVTENRKLSRKLSYQASHDPLTGLSNRLKFDNDLHEAITDAERHNHRHMLLYMDLDKFKRINDICGHSAGDLFLSKIGTLMQQCIRQSDVIARLGDDEFGIILKNCTPESACEIARKICYAIENFKFDWNGKPFSCGISIGLAEINSNCTDNNLVMNTADKACYSAKEKGGHLYIYDDSATYNYQLPF